MIRRYLSIIILLHIFFDAFAQIKVSVGWDQDTIELGAEVDLMLFVMTPENSTVEAVTGGFLDSLISGFQTLKMRQADTTRSEDFEYADVEIASYGKFSIKTDDQVFNADELDWNRSTMNGNTLLSNKIRMRIWDPGQIIANNPVVQYTYQGVSGIDKTPFQAALYVRPPIEIEAMEKDSFEISPIKTIIKEPVEFQDYLIYIYVITGLIALWLSYIFYQKYKIKKEAEPVEEIKVIIPAHKIALNKLHDLDERKLWGKDIKKYQSELTFIVREYLENRFDIPALESTTDEIVKDIKRKDLSQSQISEMRTVLQVADLVKFAKSKPNMNLHQEFMEKALIFVRETKELEEEVEV